MTESKQHEVDLILRCMNATKRTALENVSAPQYNMVMETTIWTDDEVEAMKKKIKEILHVV